MYPPADTICCHFGRTQGPPLRTKMQINFTIMNINPQGVHMDTLGLVLTGAAPRLRLATSPVRCSWLGGNSACSLILIGCVNPPAPAIAVTGVRGSCAVRLRTACDMRLFADSDRVRNSLVSRNCVKANQKRRRIQAAFLYCVGYWFPEIV